MKALGWVMALFMAAGLMALWHVGYIGGSVFSVLPAKGGNASRHGRGVLLFLSGDTGFHAGSGPAVAERLRRQGVDVIAENSLYFFRTRRTPEQTGAMIADGLRRATALDPAAPLLLVGQGFGADVIAPSLPHVPADLRRRIAFVGLVTPGAARQWRAFPVRLFSIGEPEEHAVMAARGLVWAPLLCIQGRDESDSLCPSLRQRNAAVTVLPGGRSLNDDAQAVSAALLTRADYVLARRPAHGFAGRGDYKATMRAGG